MARLTVVKTGNQLFNEIISCGEETVISFFFNDLELFSKFFEGSNQSGHFITFNVGIFLKTRLRTFEMESDLVLKQIQDCHFQSMN